MSETRSALPGLRAVSSPARPAKLAEASIAAPSANIATESVIPVACCLLPSLIARGLLTTLFDDTPGEDLVGGAPSGRPLLERSKRGQDQHVDRRCSRLDPGNSAAQPTTAKILSYCLCGRSAANRPDRTSAGESWLAGRARVDRVPDPVAQEVEGEGRREDRELPARPSATAGVV
jgi:hypothetical protein